MLEAAMAFAVAMIIFSTIVTGIVELIHKFAGTRSTHLKRMIRSLFEDMVWERLKDHFPKLEGETFEVWKARHADEFVRAMTENPISKRDEKVHDRFGREIENLTQLSFAERLARSDVGRAIVAEGGDFVTDLVTDLARSFDRFGRAAAEFLAYRARWLSIGVGIALAFGANIDASRLVTTLLENPDLRRTLVEQADTAAAANEEALQRLAVVTEQVRTDTLNTQDSLDALNDASAMIRANMVSATETGLPVGYEYFPYACFTDAVDNEKLCTEVKNPLQWIRWFVMCIVAGVLIGLGGPFWYRVFQRLSKIAQIARTIGIGAGKQKDGEDGKPADVPAEETAKPKSVVDAFEVAARVHNHSNANSVRAVLGPDGNPL